MEQRGLNRRGGTHEEAIVRIPEVQPQPLQFVYDWVDEDGEKYGVKRASFLGITLSPDDFALLGSYYL